MLPQLIVGAKIFWIDPSNPELHISEIHGVTENEFVVSIFAYEIIGNHYYSCFTKSECDMLKQGLVPWGFGFVTLNENVAIEKLKELINNENS